MILIDKMFIGMNLVDIIANLVEMGYKEKISTRMTGEEILEIIVDVNGDYCYCIYVDMTDSECYLSFFLD